MCPQRTFLCRIWTIKIIVHLQQGFVIFSEMSEEVRLYTTKTKMGKYFEFLFLAKLQLYIKRRVKTESLIRIAETPN